MSCECLAGTPIENKDGTCGCYIPELPSGTGGIKWPTFFGTRNPYGLGPGLQKTNIPPLSGNGICNLEAPSGFHYVLVGGQCVLHPNDTIQYAANAAYPTPATGAGTATGTGAAADFYQNNKLLVLSGLAALAYFMFSGAKDKPKTREVTSISKY